MTTKNSIDNPKEWLDKLFESRGLFKPTGKYLYTYHLSKDEYESLFTIVKNYYSKLQYSAYKKEWYACYILWCSEWYRREYTQEDGWEWATINYKLGFDIAANKKAEVFEQGLEKYWQLSIKEFGDGGKRNFLGTIFTQGGLPFQLISQKDNKFGNLISTVLNKYDPEENGRDSLTLLIKTNILFFPKTFQNDDFIYLIESFVGNLLDAIKFLDLDSEISPSEQLNKIKPEWRKDFPIPLGDKTGAKLLDNLLLTAKDVSKQRKTIKKIKCTHFFDRDNLTFKTKLKLPQIIDAYDFCINDLTSTRINLVVFEGNHSKVDIGTSYLNSENHIKPRRNLINIDRKNYDKALYLNALNDGKLIEQLPIEESSIQLGEVPLGFIQDDTYFKLIGQSSFTTKEKSIFLIVSKKHTIQILSGEIELEIELNDFNWYYVSGEIRVTDTDKSQYRIKTNSSKETSGSIELEGKPLNWETKPSLAYKGMPTFIDKTSNPQHLKAYFNKISESELKEYEKFGVYNYVIKNEQNDILLRRKIAVLPEDFKIQFKSQNESGKGQIIVTSRKKCLLKIIDDVIDVENENIDNGTVFTLQAKNLPPANVILEVTPNLESEKLEIQLPFPSSGMFAYDSDDEPLKQDVSLDDLKGSQLTLYSDSTKGEYFKIEITLLPIDNPRKPIQFIKKIILKANSKPEKISLYSYKNDIEKLFSLTPRQSDANVRIKITNITGAKIYFYVRKYQTKIKIDYTNKIVEIDKRNLTKLHKLEPMAILISDIDRKPVEILAKTNASIELDVFDIPAIMDKGQKWIIIPKEEAKISFRPTFYFSEDETINFQSETKSLQAAVEAYNPKNNSWVIRDFLKKMVDKPDHPSWNYLKTLWDKYSYLPMTTFHVWDFLILETEALIVFMFHLNLDEEFIQRIDEEYSIIWEMIRPNYWIQAKQNHILKIKKELVALGINIDIDKGINVSIDKLRTALPDYPNHLLEYMKKEYFTELKPLREIRSDISKLQSELIQNNIENRLFPKYEDNNFSSNLTIWLERHPEILTVLNVNENTLRFISVLMFPILVASIASGETKYDDVFSNDNQSKFELKKLREFDSNWFNPVYSYFVNYFTLKNKGTK